MDKITIYFADGVRSVTMPRCRLVVGSIDESITKKMASGKLVEDIVGHRQTISAIYGYVPAADIVSLNQIVLEGGFHRVTAPGIDGMIDAKFKVSPPTYEVFKYIRGEPMWSNVQLLLTAQEVIKA